MQVNAIKPMVIKAEMYTFATEIIIINKYAET